VFQSPGDGMEDESGSSTIWMCLCGMFYIFWLCKMSHAANDVAGPAAKVDFALGYDKLRVFSWTTREAAD